MKHNPDQSDPRVCASREPKPEQRELVPDQYRMLSKSKKTGNVLSTIESQGFRNWRASAPDELKPEHYPSGNCNGAWRTFRPGNFCRETGKNGQPEGYAVTGTTQTPWVAGTDRKTWNAAGQNNSNPTP